MSTAVTTTSSRPPACSSMKRAICRSVGGRRSGSNANDSATPATMPTVATTKTSGMPSCAISQTASRPTISMAAGGPRAEHPAAQERAARPARPHAGENGPKFARPIGHERFYLSPWHPRHLRHPRHLSASSPPEQRFSREGDQHHDQPDLPPALAIFDVARRVLRVQQPGARRALDGIRKLLDRRRRRIRFARIDAPSAAATVPARLRQIPRASRPRTARTPDSTESGSTALSRSDVNTISRPLPDRLFGQRRIAAREPRQHRPVRLIL